MNSEQQEKQRQRPAGGPETIERLLAYHASRTPEKIALIDPINREVLQSTSAAPERRRYDYATLERTVARIAAKFAALGLEHGDYVALQMPNLSETYIVILGLLRARLVPCLLPMSWAGGEIDRALDRLKPAALVSCGWFEGEDHSLVMRDAAFRQISVRHVFGLGRSLAEGVESLEALIEMDAAAEEAPPLAAPASVNDLALITFIDPATCVPHTHGQMLACGLLQVLETGLASSDHLLSAYPPSSVIGLAALAYPWLITGATLSLHHPLDRGVLSDQLAGGEITFFAAPDQLIAWLMRSSLPKPARLGLVWRHGHLPDRATKFASSDELVDLWNLGDIGCVPVRRSSDAGRSAGLFPHGRVCLPSDSERELCLAAGEVVDGTLHIRGRIFPNPSLLSGGIEWLAFKKRVHEGAIDTGIAAFPGPDGRIYIGEPPHASDDTELFGT